MKKEIKIMNMDVFDDVTMGKIIFRIGEHEKAMKCLWRTVRVRHRATNNRLPRGSFLVRYKPCAGFLPALVVSFSTQSTVGVLPYRHTTWQNFGNGIYLLNPDESIVSEREYSVLVNRLVTFGVKEIEIEDASKDTLHDGENFLFDSKDKWEGWK